MQFDADSEPIIAYLERIELFFKANEVVLILLSNIGAKCMHYLKVWQSKKHQKRAVSRSCQPLKGDFEPAAIVITEQFQYRDQAAGERIGDYITELHRLTVYFQYEATTDCLEEALWDNFGRELRNKSTRKHLLTILE